jgi:hypothetical protein
MLIPLRADFDAQMVRSFVRRSKDGPQARRLSALAAIYDHCCDAWNMLLDQPWRIMSIGLRDSAYRS